MTSVINNRDENRYELDTAGMLSVADYYLSGDILSITHVGVPDMLRGQGIAAKLMQSIVEDAKANGWQIVPVCSYAAAYLQKHPLQ